MNIMARKSSPLPRNTVENRRSSTTTPICSRTTPMNHKKAMPANGTRLRLSRISVRREASLLERLQTPLAQRNPQHRHRGDEQNGEHDSGDGRSTSGSPKTCGQHGTLPGVTLDTEAPSSAVSWYRCRGSQSRRSLRSSRRSSRRSPRRSTPWATTATVATVAAVRATGAGPTTPARRIRRLARGMSDSFRYDWLLADSATASTLSSSSSSTSASTAASRAWIGMRPLATS